jgi:large subunit ribosomal protein L2
MSVVSYGSLTRGARRFKPLTVRLPSNAGRNNRGVITTRHQGGGLKKLYRIIDFKQNRMNIPARVETVEYDPYRNAFVNRIVYRDGARGYILAVKDVKVGDEVVTSETAPLKPGNRLPLGKIPVGSFVSNVELAPGGGGKLARSAGSYAEVLAHEGSLSILKLGSKEVRKVPSRGLATVGQVSNPDWSLASFGKAGRSRWLGIRPTVRGSVMNPVDHPYGGGEGKQPRGTKRPKTRWGKITGGRKTRNRKKWSTKLILERRPKVR